MDLFRESAIGQIIRYATKNKYLLYPEEKVDFRWEPLDALLSEEDNPATIEKKSLASPADSDVESPSEKKVVNGSENEPQDHTPFHLEPIKTGIDHNHNLASRTHTNGSSLQRELTRTSTVPYTRERFDVEQVIAAERTKSIAIAPTKTADGTILVDWYTTDDVENPQNCASVKKSIVLTLLCLYSLAVYGASSMYVPGEGGVMDKFHVGATPTAIGLAIYVVGYGIGPLLFAPMSEIASIGRNWVYVPTFTLFVILSVPTALVDNYTGLLVLRFLTGFFGSPCLANGGASVGGPAIGPIIAGFAVQANGWRWGLWEIVWMTGPILVFFLFLYPETSADNILRRRAQRLRKLTGRDNIKSKSEIEQAKLKTSEVFIDALIKPLEIIIKDPAVAFTNIYVFFPLVYPPIYGFNLGEVGLCFVTIGIACLLGVSGFLAYQYLYLIPDIIKNGLREPEHRLVPALLGVIFLPTGYFMFGWTARSAVHWIASLIGVTILVAANFLIFQCVFVYLPLSYPRYAASLFAANDLSRSMFAAACILFSRPMFINLGIGGGVSLLAGLSCLGVVGMFYLWKYGGWLRSKSTFAAHG
ncbi:related to FLR1-Putative H+ antiporter regulated by yAP-1 and involved in multidrug resistance [Rhynchosporium secalis]|uniref:Related to FLR1-Putative H+ antiporter regulated by yAP-1 and involved in multidrug resistance n=1 Tax=Rhynchosporium secalis TaxID=38038 RepID=A0A1E1MI61_RHYSE|nr:related to FLR1-Putative H+ antiporter regulated by yAP-1 and involved in multidrug resistance [Rhynchosporium secalis]